MRLVKLLGNSKAMLVLVLCVSALIAACGQETVQAGSGVPVIDVAISDFTNEPQVGWAVTSYPSSVSEGRVEFDVTNINMASTQEDVPDIAHTLWVIKTDLPPDDLPIRAPGRGINITQVDVWAAAPVLDSGEKATLNLDLVAGNYVLICNIVPDNIEFKSHYEQGSFTEFTVRADN